MKYFTIVFLICLCVSCTNEKNTPCQSAGEHHGLKFSICYISDKKCILLEAGGNYKLDYFDK